jgi:hypothetical protein
MLCFAFFGGLFAQHRFAACTPFHISPLLQYKEALVQGLRPCGKKQINPFPILTVVLIEGIAGHV